MDQLIDEHLERMAEPGEADRRNGRYRRHLLTELGAIELTVPRIGPRAPPPLRAFVESDVYFSWTQVHDGM
jgi:hypothetical protein